MSDRLHLIDPDPTRGCAPGCGGCAQLEADFGRLRRHDAAVVLQVRVNEMFAEVEQVGCEWGFRAMVSRVDPEWAESLTVVGASA